MKKEKILLVDPLWKYGEFESPNIKLGYAASIIENGDYTCEIIDFLEKNILETKNLEDFAQYREQFYKEVASKGNNSFLVYLNCEYGMLHTCIELSKHLKTTNIQKVAVGGTFINYLLNAGFLEEILDEVMTIDYIILGDVEIGLKELCDQIRSGRGEEYQKLGNSYVFQSPYIQDLDQLPFPKWNKYDLDQYDGQLYLLATRGCKYNKCTFCDERLIWGNEFRSRNYRSLVDEIEFNIEKYGIRSFFFWDASITSYSELKQFCQEIVQRKIQCQWVGLARVTEIDEEIVQLMKQAGCVGIEIGIESVNGTILRTMHKGITTDEIRDAVEILKRNDLFTEGSFMIGYPGETRESALQTIEFAKELELDFYRWHNFQAASSFWKKNQGYIYEDWATLDLNVPNHLLTEKIKNRAGAYLDMHMVAKTMENQPKQYVDLVIGNLSVREIHELTRQAIEETSKMIEKVGHNPYI